MTKTKHLVIGRGQIGSAIKEVLGTPYAIDMGESLDDKFEVLHICFPWSEDFVNYVRDYKNKYLTNNGLVIIHGTVPEGVSEALGAVHSPVRGIHPNLKEGVLTFVKYFGGDRAREAAAIFSELGIKTKTTSKAANTEVLKLWDTTVYGWNIVLQKIIKEYCDFNGLDFDLIYTDSNKSYNEGYAALGRPEYAKYVLKHAEGPIGGHCVIPNCEILDSEIAKTILNYNRRWEAGKDADTIRVKLEQGSI